MIKIIQRNVKTPKLPNVSESNLTQMLNSILESPDINSRCNACVEEIRNCASEVLG